MVGLQHLRMGGKAIHPAGGTTEAHRGSNRHDRPRAFPPATEVSAVDAEMRPKGQATHAGFTSHQDKQ